MTDNKKHEILIVGAGIIGVCTAYYLTKHPSFDVKKHHITILEAAKPAAAASGKAGGLLALWAFPEQIVPLSFQLHQELADKYNGYENWGYRRVSTLSVTGGYGGSHGTSDSAPKDLDWIKPDLVDDWEALGGPEVTAQVHPYHFTNYILEKAKESGAVDLVIGKATNTLKSDGDSIKGVKYTVKGEEKTHLADQVLLSAGPWSSKLVKCPISGLRAHSITIDPGRQVSPYALFTELRLKINNRTKRVSPEIYARKDEVYICGEGDTSVPVPDTANDVEVDDKSCDDLYAYASAVSDDLKNGKRKVSQACYLPVVNLPAHSSPLIGETKVKNLYLAAGHSCWGINNGPATGKIMSELMLDGEASCAELGDGFDPKDYVSV